LQRLAGLSGVKEIKTSSRLIGNEFMAFPLDSNSVRRLEDKNSLRSTEIPDHDSGQEPQNRTLPEHVTILKHSQLNA
jgi:hypothetical protein